MTGVIGIVGGAEHAGLLVEDARPVAVAPHGWLLEHVDDVAEPAQHVVRRIMPGFGVQRGVLAQRGVGVERFEGVGRLGV